MTAQKYVMSHQLARQRAIKAVAEAPEGYVVTIKEPTRNLDQNAAMWPMLQAFSEQKQWMVNGAMCYLTPDEWKDVLTASYRGTQMRMAQGIGGGMVILGQHTSKMSKREFSELLDFMQAAAVDLGVQLEKEAA